MGLAKVHSGEPSGRRIYSSSRGFTGAGIGVVRFFLVRLGSLGSAKESSGSFGYAWVRSLGRVKRSSGSIEFAWIHSAATWNRRVHSCSRWFSTSRPVVGRFIRIFLGSMECGLGVVQIIWFRVGSLGHS